MRSSWPCLLAILPLHFTGWTMRPAGLLGAWLNRRPVARILQGINRWRAGKAGAGTVPAAQVRAQPLPENEARFRVLAEFVPSLLFEAEASGANSWTSRNWLDYVGRSAGEMAGEGWASTIHPDDLPGVQALWRDAMGSGSDFVSRQRIRRGSDGAWRWHQVRAVPLRGAKGEILRWLGTANDVHDLLEAKAALQEQEELLRLFVDRTPAAIAMFDHDMRYLAISRRFLRDFALEQVPDPHALIGLSHYDIFPEIPSHWRDNNRRVLAGETLSAEEEPFRRPDGRVQWVRWEMTPWHRADGTVGGLMLFSEEITARKQAEAALRASEARFRAITDAMPQLVWSARPDGMTDYHNQRWHEFTGIPPEQRTDDDWAFILHPDDRDRVLAQWRHSVTTGQAFEQEYRLRRADGGHGWILGRAVPVRDPQSGAITRWFATGTDISDAVAAREALARSHAELERLVAERTAALTRAAAEQQQAEQAMRQGEKLAALGQLAGGIAHDFNNILQIISNCAALIDGDAGGDNGVGECVGMISDATERGHGIIRRLLAFARRGELRAGPIDPAALLDDMREVLTHTLASTVVLRFTVEPGLPVLLADRGQLEAALINLAVNARDAMPEGGTLTILAAVETVGTDAAPPLPLEPGAYVRFTLSDTGPGMDEATLARACEPFFTTKPRGRGTGLGLPMARGFAEQSGGALVIDSAPGQGCTVSLWLPAPGQEAEAAEPDPTSPARAGTAWRVLLVDDEPPLLRSLAIGLRRAGFVVATAGDGPAALARLDAGEAVDVLVTDLLMPGISGIALIREAQARRRGLPAILLTGHVDDGVELAMQGAMSATFSLLGKPVGIADLADRITALLEGTTSPEGTTRPEGNAGLEGRRGATA